MFDMNHLQTLTLQGNNLEAFHNTWNMVISELSHVPDQEILQFRYFNQLNNFAPMAEDIAHYKRAKYAGTADYSFEWLWQASCRYLAGKRADYMQEFLNRGLKNNHARALPGLTVTPNGKGKGGNKKAQPRSKSGGNQKGKKAKGDSRGRSQSQGRPEGKGKTPVKNVCFAFQKGTCTKGKDCQYAHVKEAKGTDRGRSATPKPKGKGGNNKKVCAFFLAGTCKFGNDCREKTPRWTFCLTT